MITKPKPGFLINPLHPLSRGLVGWWLFNEGGGPTLRDYSGNRNHGTLTDVTLPDVWVGSNLGGAVNLDGTDDHVALTSSYTFTSAFSVVAWVNPKETDIAAAPLVGEGTLANYISVDAAQIRVRINSVNAALTFVSGHEVVVGTPYQLAVTRDPSGATALYKNGVLQSTNTGAGNFVVSYLGRAATTFYSAIYSCVMFYDRTIQPVEVAQLFANPFANVIRSTSTVNKINGFLSSSGGGIASIFRRRRR